MDLEVRISLVNAEGRVSDVPVPQSQHTVYDVEAVPVQSVTVMVPGEGELFLAIELPERYPRPQGLPAPTWPIIVVDAIVFSP